MATYSQDLRQRVIDCIDRQEGSLRQIAQRFVVSLSFVVRLLQLRRRTGSLDPKPPAGGRPAALGPDDLERLKELVRQQPDATLKELRQRLGVSCSLTAIWRALEKLRRARKKKVLHAQERDTPAFQSYVEQVMVPELQAGQGFALLTPLLWKGDVAAGRLQVPFPDRASQRGWAYWLVYPTERKLTPKIKRFREWLIAEMERSKADAFGGWPQPVAQAAE